MTPDTHVPVVQAERNALCDSLLALGPDAPTLCDPWRTRDLAAHLVLREHRPDLASGIWFAPLEGHMERGQAALAAGDYTALVERVRSGPPRWSPTHFARVDALFNTTELVIHHEDALRGDGAVGPRREVPERTSRATLSALRKSASLMFRRAGVEVRLEAPGADPITAGKGASVVTVTGAPVELLLVASGRMRVADVVLDGAPEDVETLKNARLGVS
ncbi:MAG TPA: TIGR03085 family metal-binding protein [Ornithinibacter sp.]|nr:TIGR03085 family metal-binding protein [Ornithinibacter sp.]